MKRALPLPEFDTTSPRYYPRFAAPSTFVVCTQCKEPLAFESPFGWVHAFGIKKDHVASPSRDVPSKEREP